MEIFNKHSNVPYVVIIGTLNRELNFTKDFIIPCFSEVEATRTCELYKNSKCFEKPCGIFIVEREK